MMLQKIYALETSLRSSVRRLGILYPLLLWLLAATGAWGQSITAPTLTPSSGNDTLPISVTVSAPVPSDALVYYTIDNSLNAADDLNPDYIPTTNSIPLVSTPATILISSPTVLRVAAFKNGQSSPVTKATFLATGMITAGAHHVLALRPDNSPGLTGSGVFSWGLATSGRLGTGSATLTGNLDAAPQSVLVTGGGFLSYALHAAARGNNSLVVEKGGKVRAFGDNAYQQLGQGGTTTADSGYGEYVTTVSGSSLQNIVMVAAGGSHAVALGDSALTGGRVWAWGNRTIGRIGDNYTSTTASNRAYARLVDTKVANTSGAATAADSDNSGFNDLTGIVQIAAGQAFTLALDTSNPDGNRGSVWCWGDNSSGQLAQGNVTNQGHAVPAWYSSSTALLNDVIEVAAGYDHAVALRQDNSGNRTVWCWGEQQNGRLGNGATAAAAKSTPSTVYTAGTGVQYTDAAHSYTSPAGVLNNVVHLAAGTRHTLALRADGTVWAWGSNQDGNLGDGTLTDRAYAVQVQFVDQAGTAIVPVPYIIAVGAGGIDDTSTYSTSYAIDASGNVFAWGYNGNGECGTGNTNAITWHKATKTAYSASSPSFRLTNQAPMATLNATTLQTFAPADYTLTLTSVTPPSPAPPLPTVSHVDWYVDGHSVPGSTTSATVQGLGSGPHTFLAVLSAPSGAMSMAKFSLASDLQKPTLTLSTDVGTTAEGGAPAVVRVTRQSSSQHDDQLTVHYQVDGSSTADSTDYAPLAGTVNIPANQTSVTVPVYPRPSDLTVHPTKTLVLAMALGDYIDSGAKATVTITDAPEVVSVAVVNGQFVFSRTGGTDFPAMPVNVSLAGTGVLGVDYNASRITSGSGGAATVAFGPYETSFTVPLTATHGIKPDQAISVIIVPASDGSYTIAQSSATVTLQNTEVSVTGQRPVLEGGASGDFTFNRTGDLSQALTVPFSVSGTATPGADYRSLGQRVTFPAGQSTASLTFTAILDFEAGEPDESVIVTLQDSPSQYTVVGGPATVLINDAGPASPTPRISPDSTTVAAVNVAGIWAGPDGTTIYYTTDGSTPTFSSDHRASPVLMRIDSGVTAIKAFSYVYGQSPSPIVTASYTGSALPVAANGASFLVQRDGTVWDWGLNSAGQLGFGDTNPRTIPAHLHGLSGITSLGAYLGLDSAQNPIFRVICAGPVVGKAWGNNGSLEAGFTTFPVLSFSLTPVSADIGLGQKVEKWGLGKYHSLFCRSGIINGVGANGALRLLNQPASVLTTTRGPVLVLSGAFDTAAGDNHTVLLSSALGSAGFISTLGANDAHQLDTLDISAIAVSASANYSLALGLDGIVYSWGTGALGRTFSTNGIAQDYTHPDNHPSPVLLPDHTPLSGAVAIAAGHDHAVALMKDGSLMAWGLPDEGRLGTATIPSGYDGTYALPVDGFGPATGAIGNVVAVSAGSHTLAMLGDGTLYAFGPNDHGQLGASTAGQYAATPVAVDTDVNENGIPDAWEILHHLDPHNPAQSAATADPDGDGVDNYHEYLHNTDPLGSDTDGDGVPDGVELTLGTLPNQPDVYTIIPLRLPAGRLNHGLVLQVDNTDGGSRKGLLEPINLVESRGADGNYLSTTCYITGAGAQAYLLDTTTNENLLISGASVVGGVADERAAVWTAYQPQQQYFLAGSDRIADTFIMMQGSGMYSFVMQVGGPISVNPPGGGTPLTRYPLAATYDSSTSFYIVDVSTGERAPTGEMDLANTTWAPVSRDSLPVLPAVFLLPSAEANASYTLNTRYPSGVIQALHLTPTPWNSVPASLVDYANNPFQPPSQVAVVSAALPRDVAFWLTRDSDHLTSPRMTVVQQSLPEGMPGFYVNLLSVFTPSQQDPILTDVQFRVPSDWAAADLRVMHATNGVPTFSTEATAAMAQTIEITDQTGAPSGTVALQVVTIGVDTTQTWWLAGPSVPPVDAAHPTGTTDFRPAWTPPSTPAGVLPNSTLVSINGGRQANVLEVHQPAPSDPTGATETVSTLLLSAPLSTYTTPSNTAVSVGGLSQWHATLKDQNGAAIYAYDFFSVYAPVDPALSFYIEDATAMEKEPLGKSDLQDWFSPLVPLQLSITTSRINHTLYVRQPDGGQFPITMTGTQGMVEQLPNQPPLYTSYYYFGAQSQIRPTLDWWVYDQTTGESTPHHSATGDTTLESYLLSGWIYTPAPTNLQVHSPTGSSLSLNWSAPANASTDGAYVVQWSLDGSSTSWQPLRTIPTSAGLTYIDFNLAPDTTYYYSVVYTYGNQVSPPSNTASATTLDSGVTVNPVDGTTAPNPGSDPNNDSNDDPAGNDPGPVGDQDSPPGPGSDTSLLLSDYLDSGTADVTLTAVSEQEYGSPEGSQMDQLQVHLHWIIGSTPGARLQLQRGDGISGVWHTIAELSPGTTDYSDTISFCCLIYRYRLVAYYSGDLKRATDIVSYEAPLIKSIPTNFAYSGVGHLGFSFDGSNVEYLKLDVPTPQNGTQSSSGNLDLGSRTYTASNSTQADATNGFSGSSDDITVTFPRPGGTKSFSETTTYTSPGESASTKVNYSWAMQKVDPAGEARLGKGDWEIGNVSGSIVSTDTVNGMSIPIPDAKLSSLGDIEAYEGESLGTTGVQSGLSNVLTQDAKVEYVAGNLPAFPGTITDPFTSPWMKTPLGEWYGASVPAGDGSLFALTTFSEDETVQGFLVSMSKGRFQLLYYPIAPTPDRVPLSLTMQYYGSIDQTIDEIVEDADPVPHELFANSSMNAAGGSAILSGDLRLGQLPYPDDSVAAGSQGQIIETVTQMAPKIRILTGRTPDFDGTIATHIPDISEYPDPHRSECVFTFGGRRQLGVAPMGHGSKFADPYVIDMFAVAEVMSLPQVVYNWDRQVISRSWYAHYTTVSGPPHWEVSLRSRKSGAGNNLALDGPDSLNGPDSLMTSIPSPTDKIYYGDCPGIGEDLGMGDILNTNPGDYIIAIATWECTVQGTVSGAGPINLVTVPYSHVQVVKVIGESGTATADWVGVESNMTLERLSPVLTPNILRNMLRNNADPHAADRIRLMPGANH